MKANCDWKDCGSGAANHVRYGFSEDRERAPEVAFHGDYCSRHTEYIEETFTNKHKFPLGQCPDGCDFGGMKVIQRRSPQQSPGEVVSSRHIPNSDWLSVNPPDHFVQFYQTDEFISDTVAEYVYHGLRSDSVCIIAATSGHIEKIGKILIERGVDIEGARESGTYVELDAAKTLSRFMIYGLPDPGLFALVIGEPIEDALKRGKKVRFFGEMVGVLCSNGQFAATLCLEDLWHEFQSKHSFSHLCAYPQEALTNNAPAEFVSRLCDGHARVMPGESYPKLDAELSQKGPEH